MNKFLLMSALLLAPATASAGSAGAPVSATSGMTPLIGETILLAENGQTIGSVTGGLVQLDSGWTLKDVSALRLVEATDLTNVAAPYYMTLLDAPTLMWFGPQGQQMSVKLALLSRVEWISASGRTTRMNISSH